jgi:hypothetical protein
LIRCRLVRAAGNGSSSRHGPCMRTESLAWPALMTRF